MSNNELLDAFMEMDDDDFQQASSKSPVCIKKLSMASEQWGSVSLGSAIRSTTTRSSTGRTKIALSCRHLSPKDGLVKLHKSIEVIKAQCYLNVFQAALYSIRDLMVCDYTQPHHFLGHGLVETVCDRFKRDAKSQHFSDECCRFLSAFFDEYPRTVQIACDQGIVKVLILVIERNFDIYSATAQAAMIALGLMCHSSPEARTAMREFRGLQWCLVCMRQSPDLGLLQRKTINCLFSAIDGEPANKLAMVNLGLIPEIAQVMKRHNKEWETLESCMDFLSTLVSDSEDFRMQCREEGVLNQVVASLSNRTDNRYLLRPAARALNLLCLDQCGREEIRQMNGVKTMLEVLLKIVQSEREANSPKHRATVHFTLQAVCQTSKGHQASCAEAFTLVNAQVYAAVSRQYENDQEIIECILQVLLAIFETRKSLQLSLSMRERAAMESTIRLTCSILFRNVKIVAIADMACSILLLLCSSGNEKLIMKCRPNLHAALQVVVEKQVGHDALVAKAIQLVLKLK